MRPHTLPPEIKRLNTRQRAQLDDWLDDAIPILKIMDLFKKEFGVPITYNKVQRYNAQRGVATQLSTYTDTALNADDLLALYNGQPGRFTEAGLLVVQKRAFELAAEPKTSVSKLNGLLRVLDYQNRLAATERRLQVAEKTVEIRARFADLRERLAVLRESETYERIETMRQKRKQHAQAAQATPQPAPSGLDPATERAAKVIQHCGGVEGFVAQTLPLEPLPAALRRLHDEIQNGTFRPLAPGEPPRFRVVPKEDHPAESAESVESTQSQEPEPQPRP